MVDWYPALRASSKISVRYSKLNEFEFGKSKENHLLSKNGEAPPKRDPGGNIIIPSAEESRREWFAVYTMSRHEKRVAEHCERIGIEHFLPLYTSRRSWKNRTTIDLQMPLFPNYIFVQLFPEDHGPLVRLPGVLSTVGNASGPVVIQDCEMEMLRRVINCETIEPHPYMVAGDKVRVKAGPLQGIMVLS